MTQARIPSKNPADTGTLPGTLDFVIKKKLMKVDGQLPCVVLNYNRSSNRATVRPLISMLTTQGQPVARAQIASVPVLALGGGGFTMTFPLKSGDLGWIEASDRDISLFMQSMQQTNPNSFRIHQFDDGRFIPDSFAQYTFDDSLADSFVIQSWDGTQYIAVRPGGIDITGTAINVVASGLLKLQGATVQIVNTAGTPGATGFTGTPPVMADAIINGILQSTHEHGSITRGSAKSDGPSNP